MAKTQNIETSLHPKTLALCIWAPYNRTKNIEAYYEEFLNLIKSNGIEPDFVEKMKLREIHPVSFLTAGKLEELRKFCEDHEIEEVIVSEALSAQQEKNISDYIHIEIFDRTHLILEIFEKAAHSGEGKTQVEIAMLKYAKTRLAGKGIHLAQQSGVFGLRGGPGETLKERERRHIEDQIRKAEQKLKSLQKVRTTQRKQRLSSNLPYICLIGYTNAGKSTILNALTKSDVLAEDKLFATLDTTTRELYLGNTKRALISDTVGFIQQLPPQLIEAFKSTLSELEFADLLLLIIDVSDSEWENHIKVVQEILADIEVDKPILYVFNKIDKVTDPIVLDDIDFKVDKYKPHVVISAKSKETLKPLTNYLTKWRKKAS
ncbi:GTPase HflX [candidate division TM6 bacterium RIFCSPHIGHO2_12_FULL_36_22]|nr:MAG: GTPase HflX [candidate division TM6 bacterium RIFCSPHIGHO2_12_FULL_36_22]